MKSSDSSGQMKNSFQTHPEEILGAEYNQKVINFMPIQIQSPCFQTHPVVVPSDGSETLLVVGPRLVPVVAAGHDTIHEDDPVVNGNHRKWNIPEVEITGMDP